jgi:hypothetical protein
MSSLRAGKHRVHILRSTSVYTEIHTRARAMERDTNLEHRDRLISMTHLNLEIKGTFESARGPLRFPRASRERLV